MPEYIKKTVLTVCCDMYDDYINAFKEVLGRKIKIVIDRFHVAKHYRSGLDTLRKQELKRLKKELNESDYSSLKGAMWALRKKEDALTPQDKKVLTAVFEYSPGLKQAYNFQNLLTYIFNQNINKGEASELVEMWTQNVKLSGLTCFDKFIDTLQNNWYDNLLDHNHALQIRRLP